MRLTVESFMLQSTRVQSVITHIGEHLDEDCSLTQLADLACLSPSQLDRLYCKKVGETPFTTLRRLRLKRAREQLIDGYMALQDIALAAGYSSHAAFTRAFVRQFGYPPSRMPAQATGVAIQLPLRLEVLPEREVLKFDYSGEMRQSWPDVRRMMGELAVAGARHWRTWSVLDADRPLHARITDHVTVQHFVPAAGQPHTVRNVDRTVHKTGLYAVCETLESQRPRTLTPLIERIRYELGCACTGGRILKREITVNGYTAPQERRIAYYVPVYRLNTKR